MYKDSFFLHFCRVQMFTISNSLTTRFIKEIFQGTIKPVYHMGLEVDLQTWKWKESGFLLLCSGLLVLYYSNSLSDAPNSGYRVMFYPGSSQTIHVRQNSLTQEPRLFTNNIQEPCLLCPALIWRPQCSIQAWRIASLAGSSQGYPGPCTKLPHMK